ncbi:ABC transporter permease [Candidatus Nitrosocosmicus sp. SS]|uniref:ABC transporter permease n=1 Tax=Candidatus Nitrosocosmicus agrestis TaxID=2563600 RepID=UPI00122E14FF|nr:ABC transporter permease [Candidatus Nitrosocosmicus sp. SS]KAA2282731.1 ABC transporter permease [Candidatus Nitrosocosmicus sp. SS]KAF0870336.1 ABC transporter permease [Candidatus Nitrosocosmicus sp. SS]
MNKIRRLKINEFKGGLLGIVLLFFLITITLYTLIFIPASERSEWNNPSFWIDYPKNAEPVWVNYFLTFFNQQLPEHVVLPKEGAIESRYAEGPDYKIQNYTFEYNMKYDEFPSAFSIPYSIQLGQIPPVIEVSVQRPDGNELVLYYNSLDSAPLSGSNFSNQNSSSSQSSNEDSIIDNSTPSGLREMTSNIVSQRLFSTSSDIIQSLSDYSNLFNFSISGLPAEKVIFSSQNNNVPLKGTYKFVISIYSFDSDTTAQDIKVVVEGKTFGMLGTDDLRRDISFGVMIGTPVALLIGTTVAVSSTMIGLFYGLIAGYKGRRLGTAMVIIIDIFLSIPTMVIFIILSLNFGKSLIFLIGLFVLFGWPGLALINRTFSIQIKNYPYVEASKLMGESDIRIVFRHIVPQLIPFTLANFALSVPAAILGESALSFLGFGDPSFPTWGQMLQDAHFSSAEILGYWWWIIPPGLMISITSIAFILIGRFLENRAKVSKRR